MSEYDYEDDYEEELDERLAEAPPRPPEDMKLTIEVGLSEYSPNGILELIARGLLAQIGGRDQWQGKLTKLVEGMVRARAEELVAETVHRVFVEMVADVDFDGAVRQAAEVYMHEKVQPHSGEKFNSSYGESSAPRRIEWLTRKIVEEAMDKSFKASESEWKANTVDVIKQTLTQMMAERLAKALPAPQELR